MLLFVGIQVCKSYTIAFLLSFNQTQQNFDIVGYFLRFCGVIAKSEKVVSSCSMVPCPGMHEGHISIAWRHIQWDTYNYDNYDPCGVTWYGYNAISRSTQMYPAAYAM